MFISKETKDLGEDLMYNHKTWKQYRYTISNGKFDIWTSNGVWAIDSNPETCMFNTFEKFYIHKCIKIANINNAISGENK
tara:strand:+ start:1813 stop:2052 length:240 start_codon:yes stop_codon:yes gene_type:complete